jgi:sigma-B regulation protein RsbU (phosphoserine phosphatase)
MNSGDSLVVYSDGLIEAENPRGEQFGQDRLLSVIEASSRGKLEEDILAAWQGFQAEGRQLDDVTLVTVNF